MICGPFAEPLPGLTGVDIARLASSWRDGGLWDDVLWLARLFLASDGDERAVRWHHLVLAVGNFKRQSGRRLRPGRLSHLPTARTASVATRSFKVPGLDPPVVVGSSDQASWVRLERTLAGAATATTTALLAAIWPNEHFVYDWRVHAAANGLRIHARLDATADIVPDGTGMRPISLDSYGTVREWVLATASAHNQAPAAVERALYRLSQVVPSAPSRTWRQYGGLVAARAGAP